MRKCSFESSGRIFRAMMLGDWLFTSGSVGGSRRDTRHSAGIRRSVSWRRTWSWNSWGRAATPPSLKERPHDFSRNDWTFLNIWKPACYTWHCLRSVLGRNSRFPQILGVCYAHLLPRDIAVVFTDNLFLVFVFSPLVFHVDINAQSSRFTHSWPWPN
jgi:hypothetical protein